MATFQDQLEEYRKKKRRREAFEGFKAKCRKFLMLGTGKYNSDSIAIEIKEKDCDINNKDGDDDINSLSTLEEEDQLLIDDEINPNDETQKADPRKESKCLKYTLWTVYLLFWITLYIIAIELKFGLVFLMFSALFGIYFNTRTGPKVSNEISAYSVFNKNCESIDGTLKAEQFEREIRYGAGSVR